jgi:hypothetical protein
LQRRLTHHQQARTTAALVIMASPLIEARAIDNHNNNNNNDDNMLKIHSSPLTIDNRNNNDTTTTPITSNALSHTHDRKGNNNNDDLDIRGHSTAIAAAAGGEVDPIQLISEQTGALTKASDGVTLKARRQAAAILAAPQRHYYSQFARVLLTAVAIISDYIACVLYVLVYTKVGFGIL